MEKEECRQYGFRVLDRAGNELISVNVIASTDVLIPFSETRDGAQAMLNALTDFCNYSGMEVNTMKFVSVSITCQGGYREYAYIPFLMRKGRCAMDATGVPIEEDVQRVCIPEETPVQEASVELEIPI
jgi:hypothetical protein